MERIYPRIVWKLQWWLFWWPEVSRRWCWVISSQICWLLEDTWILPQGWSTTGIFFLVFSVRLSVCQSVRQSIVYIPIVAAIQDRRLYIIYLVCRSLLSNATQIKHIKKEVNSCVISLLSFYNYSWFLTAEHLPFKSLGP